MGNMLYYIVTYDYFCFLHCGEMAETLLERNVKDDLRSSKSKYLETCIGSHV